MNSYERTATNLIDRILALIPAHPEILDFDNPWQLFKIEDFNCADLAPSLAQASWALSVAQQEFKARA